MCQQYPEDPESVDGMEGTAAHEVASNLLAHGELAAVGSLTENGIAVTDEMIEGAQLWAASIPRADIVQIEQRIPISAVHPACFGTPDAWTRHYNTITVADYKFGHGYIGADNNWQLLAYTAGLYHENWDEDMQIDHIIVQPRNYAPEGPVRKWSFSVTELKAAIVVMKAAADEAMGDSPLLHAGDHCLHCPAAHACPALQGESQVSVDVAYTMQPSDMSPEAKGLMLIKINQAQALLKAMGNGLEESILSDIRGGGFVPGWEMTAGQGRTNWSKPIPEVVALGHMLGAEFSKEACITPIQAIALLKKKGVDSGIVDAYSTKVSGAPKLAPASLTLTKHIFGGVKWK